MKKLCMMNAMILGVIKLKKKKNKRSKRFKSKNRLGGSKEVPKELKLKLMRLKKKYGEGLKKYLFPSNPKAHLEERLLLKHLDPVEPEPTVDDEQKLLDGKTEPPPFYDELDDFEYNVESVIIELDEIFGECDNHISSTTSATKSNNRIELGTPVDVKSLLFGRSPEQGRSPEHGGGNCLLYRNGGNYSAQLDAQHVELLNQHKYVMVCCLSVPDSYESFAWNASVASFHLYSEMSDSFEMVIVLLMKPSWTKDEAAFKHFLAAFHPSCLVVPFHDKSRRLQICRNLGGMYQSAVLVVAPGGNVVSSHSSADALELIPWPIPNPHTLLPDAHDMMERKAPKSLIDFLCCKTDSDYVFRYFPYYQRAPISELDSKVVALYLYESGDLMRLVCKMEQECRKSKKDLEIVVVYLPGYHTRDPWEFPDLLSRVLARHSVSCWVAPFSNTAFFLLKEMYISMEKVMIVGPRGQYVDSRGAEVFRVYGVDAYPFTFEHVVKRTVDELSQIKIESFLTSLCPIPSEHLSSSKKHGILLYFDWPHDVDPDVHKASHCYFSKFERVVLPCTLVDVDAEEEEEVNNNSTIETSDGLISSTRPKWWYSCVGDLSKNFFLRFFRRKFSTIVAFGEDGKISSVLAQRLSPSPDPCYPSLDGLEEEVSYLLDKYYVDQNLEDFC